MSQVFRDGPSVEERVVAAIAAACNVDREAVALDTSLAELAMDSIGMVTLAAHIEDAYECELASDQLVKLMSAPLVRDVVAIVERILEDFTRPAVEPSAGF